MTNDPVTAAPPSRRLLRAAEAARYVGLSVGTMAKLRMTGEGARFAKLGKVVAYPVAELDAWLDQRIRRSTSDPGPAA